MKSLPPESGTDNGAEHHGPTDFQSLLASGMEDRIQKKTPEATDFHSLKKQMKVEPDKRIPRTTTDYLIDGLTPFMIFIMVHSLIRFLLDVRYIHLEIAKSDNIQLMYEGMLRWVAFWFVMGIVALNRLIARDGKDESVLYILGLGGAVGLFTFTTTEQTGSLTNSFMNQPYLATLFNMALAGLIWWVTNRLTHECCVDGNPMAGEIGFVTGTARRIQHALSTSKETLEQFEKQKQESKSVFTSMELRPFDPSAWEKPEAVRKVDYASAPTKRLPKRHPGISVIYVSLVAMGIFALGQRVILNGDASDMLHAHLYILAYTVSAMLILMLSSLAGLRAYFQERKVQIPAGLGSFWVGLGILMIIAVLLVVIKLPMPDLPMRSFLAHEIQEPPVEESSDMPGNLKAGKNAKPGDEQSDRQADQQGAKKSDSSTDGSKSDRSQSDKSDRTSRNQDDEQKSSSDSSKDRGQSGTSQSKPTPPPITSKISIPDASGVVDIVSKGVMIILGIFIVVGLLRALAALAFHFSQHHRAAHHFLSRFFGWVDRFIQSVTHLPSMPNFRRRRVISAEVSLSARYTNPLQSSAMSPRDKIEYSYTALCALAEDLAVPRLKDQTPFEYIRSFPEILDTLRDDAVNLTNLYVVSAYSTIELDERNLDTLRKFWRSYENVRRTVIR